MNELNVSSFRALTTLVAVCAVLSSSCQIVPVLGSTEPETSASAATTASNAPPAEGRTALRWYLWSAAYGGAPQGRALEDDRSSGARR
jgi:hypothetical protein